MILTTLLRYPPHSASFPLSVPLILSQAVLIRDNVAPSTGAAITLQNQEQLGIKALAEEAEVEVETRRPMPRRVGPPQGRQGVVQSSPLEGLAKGLLERAQAAGLDKAILSTVSEFRVSARTASGSLPFVC
jgi:TBC1 domain family member 5